MKKFLLNDEYHKFQPKMIYSKEWERSLLHCARLINPVHKISYTPRKRFYNLRVNAHKIRKNFADTINDPAKKMTVTTPQLTIYDKYNAANVIVYALYDPMCGLVSEKTYFYLFCLWESVTIIRKKLPSFLVRIYFHNSINEAAGRNDECAVLFKKIINSPNVESYFVQCENNPKFRMFRLLSLIDNSVNCCMIRDADSIITTVDIINIRKFAQDKFALMINNHLVNKKDGDIYFNKRYYSHYQFPYKKELSLYPETLDTHDPSEILLCGMVSSRMQITPALFTECMRKINYTRFCSGEEWCYDEIVMNMAFSSCLLYPKELSESECKKINRIYKIPNQVILESKSHADKCVKVIIGSEIVIDCEYYCYALLRTILQNRKNMDTNIADNTKSPHYYCYHRTSQLVALFNLNAYNTYTTEEQRFILKTLINEASLL